MTEAWSLPSTSESHGLRRKRGRIRLRACLALVALGLAGAHGGCTRERARPEPLSVLGEKIAALPIDGDPATLPLPPNVTLTVEDSGFVLAFAPPIEARELARRLGWARPYAVSGDVHQQSWQLQLYVKPLPDPHNPRIATTSPRLGSWVARPELDGRPAGDVPRVVSGASPAYDLEQRQAKVVRVHFIRSP
jgi:hypothetical protein